jgi:hypothetical protein
MQKYFNGKLILKVAGRMEGFEHYIESIFGPKGALSNAKVKEGLEKLRFFRSAPEDMRSKVNALPNVVDTNFDDPKVSMETFMSMFCELNCRTTYFCISIPLFTLLLFSCV